MRVDVKVKGMHCNGCAARLERVLKTMDEVGEAQADLEEESVTLHWRGRSPDRDRINKAIQKAGFVLAKAK